MAMGKGYTRVMSRSRGRANRWTLPSDIIIPVVATVAPPTVKKSPSTTLVKLLPTGGGGTMPPQKPMALSNASKVVKEMEKEEVDKSAAMMDVNKHDNNDGDRSGGAVVDKTAKEESIKNAVLQSQEDLKTFVEAWLARPKNALVSSTLFPTSKDKEVPCG
eukprot:scaffold7259_cov77-Skeletonema_dohrnii-CCMP3373.AAC.3